MDCANFEHGLARLMGEDGLAQAERRQLLAALRQHTAVCTECAGCAELLQVLEQPEGRRDVVEAAPAEYWNDFDQRLAQRLSAEPAPAVGSRRGWTWGSVAAAVLLVGVGLWWTRTSEVPGPSEGPPRTTSVAALGTTGPLETDLGDGLRFDLDGTADFGGLGLDPANDIGEIGLYPEIEDLDPQDQEELLSWLREQAS